MSNDLESRVKSLEKSSKKFERKLERIKNRNKSVEADKEWETSKTRTIIISIFTYLAVALYMNAINISKPWLNAIVPAVAFLLSTLTIPLFKKIWLSEVYTKEDPGESPHR